MSCHVLSLSFEMLAFQKFSNKFAYRGNSGSALFFEFQNLFWNESLFSQKRITTLQSPRHLSVKLERW